MAAILGHVGEQRVHDRIGCRIDQRPTFASEGYEVRVFELVEVKEQRRGWEPQPFADLPRRKPLGSGLHEQSENIETRLVTERDKGGYGFLLFHISNMMEIQGASRPKIRFRLSVPPNLYGRDHENSRQ